MNTLLIGLRTLLLASNDIAALVGPRVYALKFPQSVTLPAIRMQIVSQIERNYTHDGDGLLAGFRVQIDSVVKETSGTNPMTAVVALAGHVKAVLSGYRGPVASPPVANFGGIFLTRVFDMFDPDELTLVRRVQEYEVWIYE